MIQLLWDNASGRNSRSDTSSANLENSQCRVGAGTVTVSGRSRIITLDVTFKAPFNGPRNTFMFATDYYVGKNTGWVQKGTYTVNVP